MHLLDVGSGLGGPARHLAAAHGCRVTGIDLSTEYVTVATSLTRRMGLTNQVNFQEGSATALPFDEATFDGATLLHVGMNIADKRTLCANVHRVLRPDGFFAIYDVMRTGPVEVSFPVPWSSGPKTSFLDPPETYRAALTEAGFTILAERSRAMFARDFFAALRARQTQSGPPPLGLQIVMGATTPQKIANMSGLIDRGVIALTEMIARRSLKVRQGIQPIPPTERPATIHCQQPRVEIAERAFEHGAALSAAGGIVIFETNWIKFI